MKIRVQIISDDAVVHEAYLPVRYRSEWHEEFKMGLMEKKTGTVLLGYRLIPNAVFYPEELPDQCIDEAMTSEPRRG